MLVFSQNIIIFDVHLDYSIGGHKIGVGGGVSSSNIDSQYSSVTEQSGIYAGEEGFDIRVEKNTDLKGGVIASEAEAEKNKISTGTLTWEDIKNKAEYEADSKGIAIDTRKSAEKTEAGVTPNIGMPAADEAESTTRAAIAEGTIEIRDKENQKQDVSQLNRDTQNSLNKLGEIFDLDDVKEKQEFAGLFQETAHRAIGDLTGKISSEEKAVLNAFIDGLIAQWTNGDFLAGASGTALLESMQGALNEIEDPAMKQIAAGLLGAVAGEIVGGNAQAGASGAISTEKYNHLEHYEQEQVAFRLEKAKTQEERLKIIEDALAQSEYNRQTDPEKAEVMEKYLLNELEKITKYDNNVGVSFEVNPDLGLHNNLIAAKNFFREYNVVKHLPAFFSESVKIGVGVATEPIVIIGKVVEYGGVAYSLYKAQNKYGDDTGKIIADIGVESAKSFVFNAVTKAGKNIVNVGIIILTEAGMSVYIDVNYKDDLVNSGSKMIDEILTGKD